MKKLIAKMLILCTAVVFVGCGSNKENTNQSAEVNKSVDLVQVMDKIESQVTFPEGMMELSSSDLENLYGISSAEYVQFVGKIVSVGTNSEEVVIIEASNGEAAKSIKEKMDTRYKRKLADTEGYLPQENDKISKGTVLANGNYVALLVAGDSEQLIDVYKEALDAK